MLLSFGESIDQFTPLDWGLWALGFVLLAVFLVPVVVTAAGILILRYGHSQEEADIQAVHPDGVNPDYTARFEELEQLGFRPVGSVYEELWLFNHEFYKCFPVRMMVSRDGLMYAAIYDLGWGGVVRVALDSITDRGRLIQTAMPGAEIRSHDAEFHRRECPLGPVADLVRKHDQEIDKCLQKTGGRIVPVSLAERTALDEKVGRRLMTTMGAGSGLGIVAVGWGIPFGIALAALQYGFDQPWPRAIGLAAVLAAAGYLFFTLKFLPAVHRLLERLETDPPCCRG